MNVTNIPAPRVPFIDLKTGMVTREWFRWLDNVFALTGNGQNSTSIADITQTPSQDIQSVETIQAQIASLNGRIESIENHDVFPVALPVISQDDLLPRIVGITEAELCLSDLVTADVSTIKHGFAPKLPNDATKYLNGTGQYTVPASPSGSALTKTDDTNVTLTLGGNPTTALLAATSITAGWTGTLSPTRGGTGVANNAASTITISGNYALTATLSNTTSVTFPTSGTLATLTDFGAWTTFSGTYATSGAPTWTGVTEDTLEYTINNKMMTLNFRLSASSVSAGVQALRLTIPASKTSAKRIGTTFWYWDNTTTQAVGSCETQSGSTYIYFYRDFTGSTNWSAATGTTYLQGSFTFEIQ